MPVLPPVEGRGVSRPLDRDVPTVRPGQAGLRAKHILGREREQIPAQLRERYPQGASLRDLVAATGRSYGWIRTLLLEADVTLRTRGGNHTPRHHPETNR